MNVAVVRRFWYMVVGAVMLLAVARCSSTGRPGVISQCWSRVRRRWRRRVEDGMIWRPMVADGLLDLVDRVT